MRKSILTIAVAIMTVSTSMTALAGTWEQDATGWWWQEDNGSYPVSCWQWIDGNRDGVAESYCFDETGYIYVNTITPDNYTVNADGAWTVNGIVQTKPTDGGAATGILQQNQQMAGDNVENPIKPVKSVTKSEYAALEASGKLDPGVVYKITDLTVIDGDDEEIISALAQSIEDNIDKIPDVLASNNKKTLYDELFPAYKNKAFIGYEALARAMGKYLGIDTNFIKEYTEENAGTKSNMFVAAVNELVSFGSYHFGIGTYLGPSPFDEFVPEQKIAVAIGYKIGYISDADIAAMGVTVDELESLVSDYGISLKG